MDPATKASKEAMAAIQSRLSKLRADGQYNRIREHPRYGAWVEALMALAKETDEAHNLSHDPTGQTPRFVFFLCMAGVDYGQIDAVFTLVFEVGNPGHPE